MISLHPPKRRLTKVRYLNYDIEDLNWRLYNDLPLKSYQEKIKIDWNLKHLMYEGETYKRIKEISSGYHYITSYGRILNAKRCIEMTISSLKGKHFVFHTGQKRWKLEEIMTKYNFPYDYKELEKYYKSINYKISWIKG